ncbi:hypothetical protein CERSUDRAFT_72016 [Gelatoporia subvermispora B]|uniref:F-box domain-containing protein n=1 Tax=Ceriporiopsis subvermispora (strain B) TaxID=914234 RepID=M2QT71_CERS8|nr:hypothetical protein CERSUDRAFT_72016 [Gelatoporia subvermispora B]
MCSTSHLNYDVIEEICEFIVLGGGGARRGLRDMALVSRAFCELALNILWRDLRGIRPLVKLLFVSEKPHPCPREIRYLYPFGMFPCLVLDKPISAAQWERVQFYAPRVRTVIYGAEYPPIDPSIIYAIGYYAQPHAIFPRLHKLTLNKGHVYAGEILCFISETLEQIFFGAKWRGSHHWPSRETSSIGYDLFPRQEEFNMHQFLPAIYSRAPQMRHISLKWPLMKIPLEGLALFRDLQKLSLNDVFCRKSEDLSGLASLPHLEELSIELPRIPHPLPSSNSGFGALKHLVVWGRRHSGWHALRSFLAAITSTQLSCILIHYAFHRDASYEPCGCEPPLSHLLQRRSPSMHRLTFQIYFGKGTADIPDFMRSIGPFLQWSELRVVSICLTRKDGISIMTLPGDMLFTLAESWPNLELLSIALGQSADGQVTLELSINGVVRFILRCPNLRRLRLPSAIVRAEDLWADIPRDKQHALESLKIGYICREDKDDALLKRIRVFLRNIFPFVANNYM